MDRSVAKKESGTSPGSSEGGMPNVGKRALPVGGPDSSEHCLKRAGSPRGGHHGDRQR